MAVQKTPLMKPAVLPNPMSAKPQGGPVTKPAVQPLQATNHDVPAFNPGGQGFGAPQGTTPGGLTGTISNRPYQTNIPRPNIGGPDSGNASSSGHMSIGRPYNANPQTPGNMGNFDQFRDSAIAQAMRTLQPQIDQGNESFEAMMTARGIQPGTAQYDRARANLDRRNNDLLTQAAYGGQQQGLAAQNQFFNQGYQYDQLANALNQSQIAANASMANARTGADASMNNARLGAQASMYGNDLAHALGMGRLNENARQFDINDIYRNQQLDLQSALGFGGLDLQQQNQNLQNWNAQQNANMNHMNLINALMGNIPGTNFQGSNVAGNVSQAGQAQANANAQAMGGLMNTVGGLFGLFSDKRLKENIEFVKSVDGVNVYDFDYKDKSLGAGRYRGVMAQELLETHPEALLVSQGHYMVDYSKLPIDMEVVA